MRPRGQSLKPAIRSERDKDVDREETLRKLIMDQTGTGKVDFDILLGRVVANMPETWLIFARAGSSGSPRRNAKAARTLSS
jgi:hypothetical protein